MGRSAIVLWATSEPRGSTLTPACTRRSADDECEYRNAVPCRIAPAMARRPQSAARQGTRTHAPARPGECATACASLGQGGQDLCVRLAGWAVSARRTVRRPQPARGLSLHAYAGIRSCLRRLFVPLRPRRCGPPALRARRPIIRRHLARAPCADRAGQEADGLALPLGLVLRQ